MVRLGASGAILLLPLPFGMLSARPLRRRIPVRAFPRIAFVLIATLIPARIAIGQNIPSGFQIVLDGSIRMINKDVQQSDGTFERWAIMYDPVRIGVGSTTPGVFIGNVFRATGGEPAFVYCSALPPPDSQNVAFQCWGADKCETSSCPSNTDWTVIASADHPFVVPASFFEPRPVTVPQCPTDRPLTTLQTDCHTVGYYYQSAIEVVGLATTGQAVVLVVVSKSNSNPPVGLSGNVVNATAFNLTAVCQLDSNGSPTQCAPISATGNIADSGNTLNVTLQGQTFSYGFVKASVLQPSMAALTATTPEDASDNLAGTMAATLMPALTRELETAGR